MKIVKTKKYWLFLGVFFIVLLGIFLLFISKKIFIEREKLITISQKENNKENEKLDQEVEIIFVGDLMFDRYIREVSSQKGNDFIFQKITNYLKKSDLVIANLEGPITNNSSKSIESEFESPENYIFTFDVNFPATLRKNNIKLVNLGNNHILNFGKDGFEQTINYLENNSIKYFGDVEENFNEKKYIILEINKMKFGFINYNQFSKNSSENVLRDIEKIKNETDFIVVYAHWGEEYENRANLNQKKIAHQFIDRGANLIIGSHPHIIQEKEIYNNKFIYYSLGNFIFDQYFKEETKKGLVLKLNFNKKTGIEIVEEKEILMINNGQTIFNNKE